MFEIFEFKFARDSAFPEAIGSQIPVTSENFGLQRFFERYVGATFNEGVYRVITTEIGRFAHEFVRIAYPLYSDKVTCFASDWLGRLFCLDSDRREDGEMAVLMLEPGTGEALNIPANLRSFHDSELIQYTDAALALKLYRQWLGQGGKVPRFDQCIGYKKPLFLGGADVFENMELSDLDVYWNISAQLIHKVRGLPVGTKIGKISLS